MLWSWSHKPAHNLLHNGVFFLVALVAMIVLATLVTGRVQTNSQQFIVRSTQVTSDDTPEQAATTSSATTESPITEAGKQTTTNTTASASKPSVMTDDTPATATSHQASTPPCNTIAASTAKQAYTEGRNAENGRHSHIMFRLRSTGLVTSLLNPAMYDMQLQQENDLHTANLSRLIETYQHTLTTAHCD